MKPYSFGDILLVPFPFTNQSASKQRPAVAISTKDYNQERADVIIMAITSQIKSAIFELGKRRIAQTFCHQTCDCNH